VAVAGVTVLFGFVLLGLVDRYVFRRLDGLRRSMDGLTGRLTAGERDLRAPAVTARDEVGRAEDAISRFVQAVVSANDAAGREKPAARH
jgi:HAMP domain-containing protein